MSVEAITPAGDFSEFGKFTVGVERPQDETNFATRFTEAGLRMGGAAVGEYAETQVGDSTFERDAHEVGVPSEVIPHAAATGNIVLGSLAELSELKTSAASVVASPAHQDEKQLLKALIRPAVEALSTDNEAEPKFSVRKSTLQDIPAMVEIDLRSFSKVYENYDGDIAAQREELTKKFLNRYSLVGGEWMPVVTQQGAGGEEEIVGFMTSCPTSKDPSKFVSWEETTDNGRLNSLYDPEGKNVYVVTLSMDPKVKGQRGQNLLFLQQIATFIGQGMDTAFFESRMPGLRNWVKSRSGKEGRSLDDLSEDEKLDLAQEYFGLTRTKKGKQVPYDPLLKVYAGAGCNLLKVLPDAYKDEQSMNFGVLCTFENPMPTWARNSPLLRKAAGGAIAACSKSSWLARKLFG